MQIRGTVAGMYGIRQLQVKRGTVAGIYGIRRLQFKRCGRLGLGPSSRLTVAVVFQGPAEKTAGGEHLQDKLQNYHQRALGSVQDWGC